MDQRAISTSASEVTYRKVPDPMVVPVILGQFNYAGIGDNNALLYSH